MSSDPNAAAAPLAALNDTIAALRTQAAQQRAALETSADASQRSAQLATLAGTRDRIRATLGTLEPADLVEGLDARVPLALLPVRLETRFADAGTDVLHVRIFPDDVHVDGHDPALTETEAALGATLWAASADLLADGETPPGEPPAADAPAGRRALWAALVRVLGGPRAAWVAHATRPGAAPATTKADAYVSPPVARALPDRWLVRAYVGSAVVGEAWTSPVGVDLHLAPDPQSVPDSAAGEANQPSLDPELRWLVDYATAVAAGMAVDVTLPGGTSAVDRVVAVGVRASTSPADAASELATLLAAHQYTDGLGFLPTGSATSNTPAGRSAQDRSADPDELWRQEFGPPPSAGTAGPTMAGAFGLAAGSLDGAERSADGGDAHAHAMQTALWAATWGYYLGELIDPSALGATSTDAIRGHYLSFVRGRGTLPVLRLGRQPYGVLPLLSLGAWTADGADATVDGLASLLQRIRPLWRYGVDAPVTSSEGPAFDDAFTRAMSTDAVSRGYEVRSAIADRTFDPSVFTGIDTTSGTGVLDAFVGNLLAGGQGNPLILDVFSPTAQPVRAPLVVDPSDPAPDATAQAAIRSLAGANPAPVLIDAVWLRPGGKGPATVLHTLLRRSMLLEYAAAGVSLAATVSVAGTAALASTTPARTSVRTAPPSMLAGLSPDPAGGFTAVVSLPEALSTPAPQVTGTVAVGEWLWQNPGRYEDHRRTLDETLAALGVLATLDVEELELLVPEVLDLATHRWTAWAESVAADKLSRLRSATPTGIALGGWGIVEGVSRRARTSVDPSLSAGASTGPLWADTRAGGFVHAPSTAQSATAAVLRAAHLAHGGEQDAACAVDLSSAPARTAARLAAGIRAGQELGVLLGYELESDLHARSADELIAPLRAYAPRWKAGGTFVEGEAEEIVSPSAVVDGLAVADADPAAVAAAVLPAGSAAAATLAAALSAALDALHSHQHALADLLTAEAVHQTLLGNTSRAGAALDAASRGGLPPEDFDVTRTPRNGTGLTCRVAVLLPAGADGPLAGGWPESPRRVADPDCSAWLASVLPPVARIRLRIADAAGSASDIPLPPAAALGPLDIVLDRPETVRTRILLALDPGATLVSGRDPAWSADTVGLDELLTVAGDLREVLATRPLRRTDLMNVGTSEAGPDERDAADLQARVASARTRLHEAAEALTATTASAPASARVAISSALALGVVLHVADPASPDDLAAGLAGAAAELARRLAAPPTAADATVDDLVAVLKGLLGAGQPAVPRLLLDADAGGAASAGLSVGDGLLAQAPDLAADWLDDVAAVRAPAGRFAAALQGCDALTAGGGLQGGLRIVEPSGAADAWSATLGAAELADRSPVATIVAWAGGAVDLASGSRVSGLLVDEWVEVVPEPIASTSIAYEAEVPCARAPQAVLLGLAPSVSAGWSVEAVVDLVLEAADLTGLRGVDSERAAWLGRMLPAILLPDGDATEVIAAPALPLLQVDAAVLAAQRARVKELG